MHKYKLKHVSIFDHEKLSRAMVAISEMPATFDVAYLKSIAHGSFKGFPLSASKISGERNKL